ncbi:response regulator [Pelagicoccus sp. SDUM812005]|uniref:response regulator n=1 Tax=Pelagicoccus sp. SDUM812005 TaxID=3041257 RepID=UPI00280E20F2|nr:response regulator [Pelagicoccus sp. SDUM812005]MDQ8180948.1 response regulator [Pelagicoccus sp. SDUM812005]
MKKNVLLVEDDPALRMVMREVLKDEFDVDEADNGDDGIHKGLTETNDLIILDYHLPKKDGLQVIEAVKAAHPNVPVIVLTGFLSPDSEAQFNQLGASKIFPKPFNYRALLEVVRNLTVSQAPAPAQSQASSPKAQPKPLAPAQLAPTEAEMFADSLATVAALAEKLEFLQSVTEKYWIEPSDISTIRETARCMEGEIQSFYGKVNNTLFDAGGFTSPLIAHSKKPHLSGNN